MRMASASSSKGITAATGPNTSSVLTGSSGLAGAITVGGNQKPAPAGQLPRRAADPSGTYEATRARCSAEIRGPISVPSAAGSPTCKPRTAGSSSSMNSSNTCRCTRMRERAQQSWPALSNAAAGAVAAARCRSASANTILAFFPPSSSVSRLTCAAHTLMTCLPASVDPVNTTLRTAGWATSRSPATAPWPASTCTTPSGTPASRASSPIRSAVSGVSAAGLTMTGLPAASAGASPQDMMGMGKFHGTMTAVTPSGSQKVTFTPPATGICRPVIRSGAAAKYSRTSRTAAASWRACATGCPASRTSSSASSAMCSSTAAANARSRAPRSAGAIFRQAGQAAQARATAASASAADAAVTVAVTSSVAGLTICSSVIATSLEPFKAAQNRGAERGELGSRVVRVVRDHIAPERQAGHVALLPCHQRVTEAVRHARRVGGVRVRLAGGFERQALVDAVQSGCDHRGDRDIGVDVTAWHPVLDPQRRAAPDQPHRAGAVVGAPADGGRGETGGGVTLERVDVGRVANGQLAHRGELAGQEVLAETGQPVRAVAGEQRRAVGVAKREVDVAGVALPLVGLGHEGDAHARLGRDLLRACLVDCVIVAGLQGVGVPEGDLVLAQVAFAFGRLHVHAGALHRVAYPPQQRLDPRGAENGVVDVVPACRGQPAVAAGARVFVAVAEDDELKLGASERGPATPREPFCLLLENLARRGRHGAAVMPGEVGEHQRRRRVPGHPAQRGSIGHEYEVAVAAFP